MFLDLLKFLGVASISAVSLSWLTRKLIEHFLDKDIERFKNEIRLRNEFEIEQFKSNLQTESSLQQIRFSNLHVKRAELIHEVFQKLVELEIAAEILVTWVNIGKLEDIKEPAETYLEAYFAFHSFYRKHQIFFLPELSKVVTSLHSDLFNASLNASYHLGETNFGDFKTRFKAEFPSMQLNAEKARQIILSEFRGLLGVTSVTG